MRKITNHKINENDRVDVTAMDKPGLSGANYCYALDADGSESGADLNFQDGPIGEVEVDGITDEALLAVLIDRLRGFQSGPYKCRENAIALTHLEEALRWYHRRTRDRMARGVEGKSVQRSVDEEKGMDDSIKATPEQLAALVASRASA